LTSNGAIQLKPTDNLQLTVNKSNEWIDEGKFALPDGS